MPKYKDLAGKLYALDDDSFRHLLPDDAALISEAEYQTAIAPTPEQVAATAQAAQDHANVQELRADAKFQAICAKTPQQCINWAKSSFPTLTLAEQRDLGTLVQAIVILGRRL